MMEDTKEEYLMLREEILHLNTIIINTIHLLYTFIASFLAFALTQEDTIFILLTYIMIVPAYLIVVSKMSGMARIGAYLYVFHEGKNFNWEHRNIMYKGNVSSHLSTAHLPFFYINIVIFFLLLIRTAYTWPLSLYEGFKLACGLFLFIYMMYIINKSKIIHTNNFIIKWESIKKSITKE